MKILAEFPRVESVAPSDRAPLADFSCGQDAAWEREINSIFNTLASGAHGDAVAVRSTEDASTGDLIGVAAYVARPLRPPLPGREEPNAAYIQALGISEHYR